MEPIAYCVKLASKMSVFDDYDIRHLISYKYLFEKFDRESISEMSKLIADPINTIVFLATKAVE